LGNIKLYCDDDDKYGNDNSDDYCFKLSIMTCECESLLIADACQNLIRAARYF